MSDDAIRGGAAISPASEELAAAIEEYKRRSGRAFPTWTEVLEVLRGLGYEKAAGRGGDR